MNKYFGDVKHLLREDGYTRDDVLGAVALVVFLIILLTAHAWN